MESRQHRIKRRNKNDNTATTIMVKIKIMTFIQSNCIWWYADDDVTYKLIPVPLAPVTFCFLSHPSHVIIVKLTPITKNSHRNLGTHRILVKLWTSSVSQWTQSALVDSVCLIRLPFDIFLLIINSFSLPVLHALDKHLQRFNSCCQRELKCQQQLGISVKLIALLYSSVGLCGDD